MRGGALCPDGKDAYNFGEEYGDTGLWIAAGIPGQLIKKLGPYKWLSATDIERELTVARTASTLGVGPAVHLACLDEHSAPPIGYLVMDKIEGVTYGDLYKEGVTPPADVTASIKGLLDALYNNGIAHTDRNPGNFMLGTTPSDPKPRWYIIDFGITRPYEKGAPRKYAITY